MPRRIGFLASFLLALAAAVWFAPPARAAWLGPHGTPVASTFQNYPVGAIADGAGGILVAYQGLEVPGGPAIRLQRVTSEGEIAPGWPADGVVACSLATTVPQGALRAVSDGAGGVFLLWLESYIPPFNSTGTAYVQHVLATGERAAGWPGRGRLLAGAPGQNCLDALPDGAGGVIAAWHDTRSGQVAEIRVTRWRGDGTNPPGFGVLGRAVSEPVPSAAMIRPTLRPDGTSGFWVSYVQQSSDTLTTPSSNQLVHLQPSGLVDPSWAGNGFAAPSPFSSGIGNGAAPLADGSGGAYFLVTAAGDEARLHHVLGDLTLDPAWPAEGLLLGESSFGVNPAAPGRNTQLVSDGNGGLFAAWSALDGVFTTRLALRRVLETGELDPGWPAPQIMAGDWEPTVLADPGGAFVCGTWQFTCPSHNCLCVSAIGRRTSEGATPASWDVQPPLPGLAGQFGIPAADSATSGPVAMVRDGGAGVIAAWARPVAATATSGPATVRVMRFADLGPVAAAPAGGGAPGSSLRARWVAHSGIHATSSVAATGRLEVCDVTGRRVAAAVVPASNRPLEWAVPGTGALPPGLYFLGLRSPAGAAFTRVVVAR